jgi:ornithine carbamoyltransferase
VNKMKNKDFVCINDLAQEEFDQIIDLAIEVKKNPSAYATSLKGKTLAMIFQKPSTRTRISFEVGIYQLGGIALYLSSNDLQLGRGETVADTAKVLSRYVDGIMARVFSHQDILALASNATIPVINGLSDLLHPCQGMADYLTIREKKGKGKLKIAYVGDGNNVAHSLLYGAPKAGLDISVVSPYGYFPDKNIVDEVSKEASKKGTSVEITADIDQGVRNADVIYTDVWTSMGQEAEQLKRLVNLRPYQINPELMKKARKGAIFMHCLPAHRGEEVVDEVVDSAQSVVFDQAENRLHVQKAIMLTLMGNK